MTTEAIQILLSMAFGAAFGLIVGFALALIWETTASLEHKHKEKNA